MDVKSLVAAAKETPSISADEIEEARDEVTFGSFYREVCVNIHLNLGVCRRFSL
eukprot:COSAG06_NODE_4209_length_4473_cov_275.412730_5_plen_54_part_00